MNKKYQVFISSTFRDLAEERQDAIRTVLDLGHIPAGMELFPASDQEQLTYIKKIIDECDYYLLIVGGRYGSLDTEGVSYTEREYDYAVESGKTVLAFIHGSPDKLPVEKADIAARIRENLQAFREKVAMGRLVKFWSDRQSLESLIVKSLVKAFSDLPAEGWVRGGTIASSDQIERSNELLEENAALKARLQEVEKTNSPQLENLAGLDDTIAVRYRYSTGGRYAYDTDGSVTLTWQQAFLGVAGELDVARTDVVILSGLKRVTKELGIAHTMKSLNKTDKLRIKAQLEALGLIHVRVSRTTQGGQAEFLTLTPRGRQLYLEKMVVRRD